MPGSSVFLASDSESIVRSSRDLPSGLPPLRIYHLAMDRSKYDAAQRIEERNHSRAHRAQILAEALLEAVLLSRARRIAGAMLGNMPRLALQLRVRDVFDYAALDGRAWCTKTACKLDSYDERYRSFRR